MNTPFEQLIDAPDLTPYDVLRKLLDVEVVTIGAVHENFINTRVPHMVVARVHLTFPQLVNGEMPAAETILTEEGVQRRYNDGSAICEFIDHVLVQDHPADKRFILRHLEQLCLRYGLNQSTCIGFGHDVIYSRGKLPENYKAFDNTLYIPPLTGEWAIVSKGSR